MPDPTPIAARPVRLHNYLAYGSNDVLGAGSMAVISGWVLIFYTQFCGLSAGQAATRIMPPAGVNRRAFSTRLASMRSR